MQLYRIKYSYLVRIIFKQVYLIQTGTTNSGQSRSGSNGKELVTLHSLAGIRGVTVIDVGNGYDNQSSNPKQGCLFFT